MIDLIDRQVAINELYNINPSEDFLFIDAIVDMLENLPSAEQKESKWIVHNYAFGRERYECAECGERCNLEYNFCPHCGAKMRGSCTE